MLLLRGLKRIIPAVEVFTTEAAASTVTAGFVEAGAEAPPAANIELKSTGVTAVYNEHNSPMKKQERKLEICTFMFRRHGRCLERRRRCFFGDRNCASTQARIAQANNK